LQNARAALSRPFGLAEKLNFQASTAAALREKPQQSVLPNDRYHEKAKKRRMIVVAIVAAGVAAVCIAAIYQAIAAL
jgi:hypothetical protein